MSIVFDLTRTVLARLAESEMNDGFVCWKAAAINQLGMAEWSNVVLVDMMHGTMLCIVHGVLGSGCWSSLVTSDFVQHTINLPALMS